MDTLHNIIPLSWNKSQEVAYWYPTSSVLCTCWCSQWQYAVVLLWTLFVCEWVWGRKKTETSQEGGERSLGQQYQFTAGSRWPFSLPIDEPDMDTSFENSLAKTEEVNVFPVLCLISSVMPAITGLEKIKQKPMGAVVYWFLAMALITNNMEYFFKAKLSFINFVRKHKLTHTCLYKIFWL